MMRKSILFTGKDEVQVLDEPVPDPGPGQVLLQTRRTLISTGTESIVLSRRFSAGTHWDEWVKYPFRAGYCNAGKVLAVGDGVTDIAIGDRVATRLGHTSHGVVNVNQVVKVPDEVSDDDAAWTTMAKIVQVGVRAAEHRLGDNVVVIGLGLLGQLVVQYMRLMGAGEIIAIDPAGMRLEMARGHGATAALGMWAAEALPAVRDLTGGRGADVVYDITGHAPVFASALRLAADRGRVVLLGDTGSPEQQHLTGDVIRRGLRIAGAHGRHAPDDPTPGIEWDSRRVCALFLKYLARAQMRVDDLVTHRYRPADAPEAYAMVQREREKAMGVVFEW